MFNQMCFPFWRIYKWHDPNILFPDNLAKNNSEFIYYGRLNQKNSTNLINQNNSSNEIA